MSALRMLLVHNPDSGEGDHSDDSLTALLEGVGGEVSNVSTSATGWKTRIHDSDSDLVVVAGGDGTVHSVMIAMASSRKPIAIIPLGTANNIARGVGIPIGDVAASIDFWRTDPSSSAIGFDVPLAVIGTGEDRWVESVGVGLVAGVLLEANHTEQDPTEQGLSHGRSMLGRALDEPPEEFHWEIRLDDQDLSGRFAAIEAMNIPAIGPRVKLAPAADPGDGLIDFVALTASQCMDMTNAEDTPEHRSVKVGQHGIGLHRGPEVHRGRHLTLRCERAGLPVHIDDRPWTSDGSATEVEVVNDGVQVRVLSPR